ncbi:MULTISPECIES: MFS transporter [unclassified Arthrobacter]|uniref:MFS transporter n=1 Tax=unclassified Arthrobacter TaxID=235627 RepID=UPI0028830D46|nr:MULTISPECIES: MFS transporter [unclassified Arthrobacter]
MKHALSSETTPTRVSPKMIRMATLGASVGSTVEFYDIAIYAYLAPIIGRIFFATTDPVVALLSSFAVFGAAFVVRPLGGLFFGSLGDRLGRQKTLAAVILLISAATFAIGVLPTYEALGIAAPIALVILRLVQGFSAGGEVGGATAFVAEYAPPHRRGFLVSLVELGAMGGFLLGSVAVLILNLSLTQQQIFEWGWRVPFLIAGPLGIVGLLIRNRLEESPEFMALKTSGSVLKQPLRTTITLHWRSVLVVAAFALFQNVAVYIVLTFISTYLSSTLKFDIQVSSFSSALTLVAVCVVVPLSGALSDKVGRKRVLTWSCGTAAILTYPLFALMSIGSSLLAVTAHIVLGLILGVFLGPVLVAMSEMFSTAVRYGGMSLGYNLSVSIFGGTAPFIVTLLIATTGNNLAPSFYVIAASLVTLAVVAVSKETAPRMPNGTS